MNEVSCRVLEVVLSSAEKSGYPLVELTAGLPVDLAHLQDPENRIDWDVYRTLMMRMARVYPTPDDWRELGRNFMVSKQVKSFVSLLRLLVNPRSMMKWIFRFGGHRLFSNMSSVVDEAGGDLLLTLEIAPAYKSCPEYFFTVVGVLAAFPTLVGGPEVEVSFDLTHEGRKGAFRVLFSRQKRARRWPSFRQLASGLRPRAEIVAEFEQNHLLLEKRFFELQTAKSLIEEQQRVLQIVHDVSTVGQENLRLLPTARAIADQLSSRLALGWVGLRINTTQDGVQLRHEELRGDPGLAAQGRHSEVIAQGDTPVGEVEVSQGERPLSAAELQLLQAVMRPLTLAINNAVAYEVIQTYRESLEAKVLTRTAELAEARDTVERSLESRNRFFANVNHEFRSPLTALLLSAERLEALSELPESGRVQLRAMQRNAERLHGLVDDLLLLSAGAEGFQRVRFVPVDVAQAVLDVVEAARPLAEAKSLSLRVQVEQDLKIEADRRQLDRALSNYVGNAIKYTDEGQITVKAERDGDGVRFSVTDTGGGIPPAYLPRVFERFVQVPLVASRPGAGIGLALVKEIAAQHNGEVGAESEVGKGSTFRLWLPFKVPSHLHPVPSDSKGAARSSPAIDRRVEALAPVVISPPQARHGGLRVLVCEDNQELNENISYLLSKAGYLVDQSMTAEEALVAAKRSPPDLLLTDLNLGSGMDGLQLCRVFREMKEHRNAPVLLLTAAGLAREHLDAFDAGVVDYLTKPFHPDELLARIRAQLALRQLTLQLMSAERLAAQGAALAGVAHELRNPLNGLVNAVDPLRSSLPAAALVPGTASAELLDVIEDCGRRVANLSHELLFYTRVDAPPAEVQSLNDVAARAVKLMGASLRQVTLSTGFKFDGLVRASSTQLSQVIMNLIENAIDAAGPGGAVEIQTKGENGCALLEVRDSGPGVPGHLRERIFEPFFTTKPPGKGTGLGLSISRDIVRRHGGNLMVSDAPAPGCTIRLVLPALAGEAL